MTTVYVRRSCRWRWCVGTRQYANCAERVVILQEWRNMERNKHVVVAWWSQPNAMFLTVGGNGARRNASNRDRVKQQERATNEDLHRYLNARWMLYRKKSNDHSYSKHHCETELVRYRWKILPIFIMLLRNFSEVSKSGSTIHEPRNRCHYGRQA